MKINNRKASVLSIWWFGVIAIVAGGIVFGTTLFYSSYVDVRYFEAEIMSNNLKYCLQNLDEQENNDFFNKNFDVLKNCNLNEKFFIQNPRFFIGIYGNGEKLYSYGKSSFEADCPIKKAIKTKYYPECFETEFFIFDEKNSSHKIGIIVSSNNQGGKV